LNAPEPADPRRLPPAALAFLPLAIVGLTNVALTLLLPRWYGATVAVALTPAAAPITVEVSRVVAIWAVEAALVLGIASVVIFAWQGVAASFVKGSQAAISGCMLASINTASEYGFGAVIAALPGFAAIQQGLQAIGNPLVNEAVTVTSLAGITGSASGGLSLV